MGPIPLNCDSPLVDEIIDELTSFGSKYKERVIYLGIRFLIQVTDIQVVLSCINNYKENINSNMKDYLARITHI